MQLSVNEVAFGIVSLRSSPHRRSS